MRFITGAALALAITAPALAQQQPPNLSDQLDLITGSISRQATDMANKIRQDDFQISVLQRQVSALTTQRDDLQKKLDALPKAAEPKAATPPAQPTPIVNAPATSPTHK